MAYIDSLRDIRTISGCPTCVGVTSATTALRGVLADASSTNRAVIQAQHALFAALNHDNVNCTGGIVR
jgi:hypothetical protein